MGNIETAAGLPDKKINFCHDSKNLLFKGSPIFKTPDNVYILSHIIEEFDERDKKNFEFSHAYLLKTFCIETEIIDVIYFNTKNRRIYVEYLPSAVRGLAVQNMGLLNELQLLHMLRCILSVLSYFEQKNSYHGFISPDSVFYDPKSGDFKIMDGKILFGKLFQIRAYYQKNYFPINAPELSVFLKNNDESASDNNIDFFQKIVEKKDSNDEINKKMNKFDVFCLGYLTLQLSNNFFVDDFLEVNQLDKFIKSNLNSLKNRFTKGFIGLIEGMLEFDFKKRWNASSLVEVMEGLLKSGGGNEYFENREENNLSFVSNSLTDSKSLRINNRNRFESSENMNLTMASSISGKSSPIRLQQVKKISSFY